MGQFDHYPDMNQDGKKDIYDCITYHDLMDEMEGTSSNSSTGSSTPPIRPRDLTAEQRAQLRLEQQAGEVVKWVMIAVFALLAWVCLKNMNGFTLLLGIFFGAGAIRLMLL
ncbi:MAG: hypothetical protein J6Q99_00470 [Oscillospiraceae bacterium]|nr:hypothetical protein [Oscillospiraceae bacterium]